MSFQLVNVGAPVLYKMIVDSFNSSNGNVLSFDTPFGSVLTGAVSLVVAC